MFRLQWLVLIAAFLGPEIAQAGWPFHHHHHRHAHHPTFFVPQPGMMVQQPPQQAIDVGSLIRLVLDNTSIIDRVRPGGGDYGTQPALGELSSRLAAVETTLNSRFTTLESKLDDTRGRIDNVAGVVQSLGKNSVEVSARLEGLETKLNTLETRLAASADSKLKAAQLVTDLGALKENPKAAEVKAEITKAHEDASALRESLLK